MIKVVRDRRRPLANWTVSKGECRDSEVLALVYACSDSDAFTPPGRSEVTPPQSRWDCKGELVGSNKLTALEDRRLGGTSPSLDEPGSSTLRPKPSLALQLYQPHTLMNVYFRDKATCS